MCNVVVTYSTHYSGGERVVGPCRNSDWRDGHCFVHHPDNKKPTKPTPQERIAELEAELRRCSDSVYEVANDWWEALEKLKAIGKIVDCDDIEVLVDVVRETRVPDDLLEWLIYKAHYAGAWGNNCDQAEAILVKRREGK